VKILNRLTLYVINRCEQKEWKYFDVKVKWKDCIFWKQKSIYAENVSGLMISKLWKWYVKMKEEKMFMQGKFFEKSNGYEDVKSLFLNPGTIGLCESMMTFNLGIEGDNNHRKSRGKPETIVTPIFIGKLKKNDKQIAKDTRMTIRKMIRRNGEIFYKMQKQSSDFWKFRLIKGCDNSHKTIGEIRTTGIQQLENDLNERSYSFVKRMIKKTGSWWGVTALITSFWGDLPAHG
jgi:hypothetical protein